MGIASADIVETNILKLKSINACESCNLQGADLREEFLPEANLSKANLSGANLSKADLSKADLSEAKLCDTKKSSISIDDSGCTQAEATRLAKERKAEATKKKETIAEQRKITAEKLRVADEEKRKSEEEAKKAKAKAKADQNWIFIGSNFATGSKFYIDDNSIKKSGGYVYFWYLLDRLRPNAFGDHSVKMYTMANCPLKRHKVLEFVYFSQSMAKGPGEHSKVDYPVYIDDGPSSISRQIEDWACIKANY